MATRTYPAIDFTFHDEDRADPSAPYFEGRYQIEYDLRELCDGSGKPFYEFNAIRPTLIEGTLYFGDVGAKVETTIELDTLAVAWLERSRTAMDRIRQRCIENHERGLD